MKIAVSSSGKDLQAQIDPRFGRCSCFLIIEADDLSYHHFENTNAALGGGAGVQSAQFVISQGAKTVITGNCGPKAMQVFSAAGIDVFTGQKGIVAEAVQKLKSGILKPATEANVTAHAGSGGMGMGRGKGRGLGKGGRSNIG
jgi:predicted Fe-Mo cluster-binding NifX family protein